MNFNDTSHIQYIKKKNNIYVVHDEESGVTHSTSHSVKNFLDIRSSDENVNLIDKFYTWGKFDHKAWTKKFKKNKEKFKMTGSPRLDLCMPGVVKSLFYEDINELKKKYKKYILFISSGISSDLELKNIFEQDKFFFKYKKKKEKTNRIYQMKNLRLYFKKSVEMLKNIGKKYKDINIVIRPHPNENINDWKKILKELNNNFFLELSDIDITALIKGSECMIHNSSFAGIQASLLKKPIIIFSPKNILLNKRNFPNKLGRKANSIKEVCYLIEKITNLKKKNFNERKNYDKALSRINFSKKKTASEKILNDLNKFDIKETSKNKLKISIFSRYLNFKNFLNKKLNYENKNSNFKYTRRTMSEKLGGGIFLKDLDKYVKFFRKINKSNQNIKIRTFGPNGFYISKK